MFVQQMAIEDKRPPATRRITNIYEGIGVGAGVGPITGPVTDVTAAAAATVNVSYYCVAAEVIACICWSSNTGTARYRGTSLTCWGGTCGRTVSLISRLTEFSVKL
jgi:hypothetical protein